MTLLELLVAGFIVYGIYKLIKKKTSDKIDSIVEDLTKKEK